MRPSGAQDGRNHHTFCRSDGMALRRTDPTGLKKT
jgi:hypothetical protein